MSIVIFTVIAVLVIYYITVLLHVKQLKSQREFDVNILFPFYLWKSNKHKF